MGNWVQELLLKITGDSSEGKKAISEVESAIKGAVENPMSAINSFGNAFKGEVLASLGEFGLVAGGVVAGVAALTYALAEMAASARESAAKLHDVQEVYGIAVPAAAKLQFTIEAAGGSMDQFTRSMFMMEQRMENSAKAFDKGLTAIHLTREEFDAMSKGERLLAISDGLRAMGEQSNKSAVAMELLGRSGRDMLPTLLKPLRDLYEQQAQVAAITEKDADAAEKFELELNTLKATSSAAWRELGLGVSVFDELNKGWTRSKLAVANIALEVMDIAGAYGYLGTILEMRFHQPVGAMPKVAGDATDALQRQKKATEDLQHAGEGHAMALAEEKYQERLLTDAAEKSIEANKKRVQEEKKFKEALTDVLQTAMPTAEALATLDGNVKEGIAYYLAHGAAVEHLARMYGVTKAQVKAVGEEMKQTETVAKSFATALVEVMKGIQKTLDDELKFGNDSLRTNLDAEVAARSEHIDRINRLSLDELDYQKSVILQEGEKKKAALNEFGEHYREAMEAIDQATEDKMNDAELKYTAAMDKMKKSTTELQDMVSDWLTSFPGLLQQAFTGGGGVEGAFKALSSKIGGSVGTDAFGHIASKLSNTFSERFGTGVTEALGTMIPGIGGVIGALAGPLFEKILHFGGPSKQELEGRDVEKKFESQFESFNDMVAQIAHGYELTGKSSEQARADVERLMAAEKNGGEAVKSVIADIQKQLDLQKAAAADLPKELDKVAGGFRAIGVGVFADSFKAFDKFKASLKPDQFKDDPEGLSRAFQAGFTIPTQEALDRTGRLANSAFSAALAGGQSFMQALDGIGPGLDAVNKGLDTFGGMTMSPEYWALANLRKFEEGHKELLSTLDGVNQMMDGLHNMGLITQQDFSDLQGVATDTYNQMIAGGVDSATALRAMQPTLQKTWEMEHDYGMAVDDATQALLDQAEQQGVVGEKMKSVQQQTLDVLKKIAEVLGADIPNAIKKIPDKKTIDIEYRGSVTGDFPGAQTEGLPSFANRPMERVTSAGLAMLHPGDFVGVPQPGMGGGITIDARGSFFPDRFALQDLADMVNSATADKLRTQAPFGLRA